MDEMGHRSFIPQTINYKNLLQGITPTFAFWTTNPATNAEMVSEAVADANLTTAGVASAAGGTIEYLLGSTKRVEISTMQQGGGASGLEVWVSENNGALYHFKGATATPGIPYRIVERINAVMFAAKSLAVLTQIRLKVYQY